MRARGERIQPRNQRIGRITVSADGKIHIPVLRSEEGKLRLVPFECNILIRDLSARSTVARPLVARLTNFEEGAVRQLGIVAIHGGGNTGYVNVGTRIRRRAVKRLCGVPLIGKRIRIPNRLIIVPLDFSVVRRIPLGIQRSVRGRYLARSVIPREAVYRRLRRPAEAVSAHAEYDRLRKSGIFLRVLRHRNDQRIIRIARAEPGELGV